MAAFDSTLVARFAAGLYNTQIGIATLVEVIHLISGDTYDSVADLANVLYSRDFASMSNADVAAIVVGNVGITGASDVALAIAAVKDVLDATAATDKGAAILDVLNVFANWADAPAQFAGYVTAFNTQVKAGVIWAQTPGSIDVALDPAAATLDKIFTLTGVDAAGADVMRLTGDQDVRIDFTNPANQVVGLDLDGDGIVEFNGSERSVTGVAANYEIVDAYSRNPLDHTDRANNFLGDIWYDGKSFEGDGVSTNGNIFLGGLGVDTAFGGVGNDFLAGGGIAQGRSGADTLSGGRNADFFFAEFSAIDATDGSSLAIDGGNTADDNSAGNGQSPQDSDWLLLEAGDDDEPVMIWLNDDNIGDVEPDDVISDGKGLVQSRAGKVMVIDDIENIDASGNLYGFLDDMNVEIGARALDLRATGAGNAGGTNYGYGSSAQLNITGSYAGNIIIAGYDNDFVDGDEGDDLLFGGNLNSLKNPNLANIWNNGRDELLGGDGADSIVFETDGGIYEGGFVYEEDDEYDDTLWLTREAFGKKTAADVTSDGTVRLDLLVGKEGGLNNAAGYGGADKAAATGLFTSDQTMYKAGFDRAQVQDFESVIATGLGSVDYVAAGANDPELLFDNQQNHFAFVGNLDLRGTNGDNVLYATGGADVLEGRDGDDALSGGDNNDDFIFSLNQNGENFFGYGNFDSYGYGEDLYYETGDGVDVIHRQTDANADNLWDTDADGNVLYERDFNIGGSSTKGASSLTVDLGTTNLASPDVAMTSFSIKIGTVTFAVTNAAALSAAVSAAEVAALVNSAYQALDTNVSAKAVGNTIVVTDVSGRDISDTVAEGYAVGGVVSNGAFSAQATFNPAGTSTTKDRLLYVAYEDRLDAERVDDGSYTGSTISLGTDSYAEDLVIDFAADGTRIAEDQLYEVRFTNLTTEDTVAINVNNVTYTLRVGVDLDGNEIANEELSGQGGSAPSQAAIQLNFLARMADFINTFMDDDTAAGEVSASATANSLLLSQSMYNGEETVFMTTPVITLTNGSLGEPAKAAVFNLSEHEVHLLDFDGRNGELNDSNVLFLGNEDISRAILETGAGAAGTANVMPGSEAVIIDGGANTLQSVVFGTTTVIADNTATNAALRTDFTVHGDDFLLGGVANDTINAGTGDDRVQGSLGTDATDGGKSYYAVQVLGEPQARVYLLNQWEATNPTKVSALSTLTISSINRIGDAESGNAAPSNSGVAEVYNDTLQFEQADFAANTKFTVTLNNYTGTTSSTLEFRSGGAGTVSVDNAGNGSVDGTTAFTNYENIRVVSGTGLAVANSGQGDDTLDVAQLSSHSGGVAYDLTNRADAANPVGAGKVSYSSNAHASLTKPVSGDFETLVIKVDGVENVITDNASVVSGDDLLMIDESEAAKNNRFTAGDGDDRIEYLNDFLTALDGQAEPQVTIKLDNTAASVGGTDTVTMTGGRVGSTVAVDSLDAVEWIDLAGNTAEGQAAGGVDRVDVIDVTAMSTGATVNYTNGQITAGNTGAGTLHLTVEQLVEIEKVIADGNDTVIVADADVMNNNARSDELNDEDGNSDPLNENTNILFMTYRDFDDKVTGTTTRKSFAAQVGDDTVTNVINQGQFSFSLSEVGIDADIDRVDYSNEAGRIVVPVGQGRWTQPGAADNKPQYVVVDGDQDNDFADAESRVDQLWSVEEIVAAKGESVMDFTDVGAARQITFQYVSPSANPAENATMEQTIRIADGAGNTLSGLNAFVERYTYNKTTPAVADATWNRIEGSDAAEVVIYQGSEDLVNQSGLDHRFTNDTLTLRGGANEVRYSPLETSLNALISVTPEDTTTAATAEGLISATITFQDGVSNPLSGGGTHTITSHTADNSTAGGTLKLEGSQDAEDTVEFAGLSAKTYILGTSPGVISVKVATASGLLDAAVLTGFEFVQDASTNDVYEFASLAATAGVTLVDNGAGDHDVIRVTNDAAGAVFNGGVAGNSTISLAALNTFFGFDFDVLDISPLNNLTSLTTVLGEAGTDDELVVGTIGSGATLAVNNFENVVISTAAVTAYGSAYTLNTTTDQLVMGSKTLQFNNNMNQVSFMGTMEGATSVPAVTSGVTLAVVGNESVEIWGSEGGDTISSNGGDDFIRGGKGGDTVNASNPTGEIAAMTLGGGAAVLAGVETLTLTGNVGTLVIAASGGVGEIETVSATADADQIGALLMAQTNAFLETELGYAAGSIASKSYDGTSNIFTLNFTAAAGNVTDLTAAVSAGTMTAAIVVTQPVGGGDDTFVFEATGANNGADTLNGVDSTDAFDFSAFLAGVGLNDGGTAVQVTYDAAAVAVSVAAATDMMVVANKGTLAAGDIIGTGTTAGKFVVADGDKVVFAVTADATGAGGTTGVQAWNLYYVSNGATAGTGDLTVTLVGTVNSSVELTSANIAGMLDPA